MKSFAFALLAASVAAAAGPTTAAVTSSSVTMAPTVTTKVLTMVMDLKWTCAAALADTNVTEMAACW